MEKKNYDELTEEGKQWAIFKETSPEIVRVIFALDETEDGRERLWNNPTEEEIENICTQAWELAGPDETELYWGCSHLKRPAVKRTITRESTYDYDDPDGGTNTVETVETWEWSPELNRYEMVYLEEKETGEYVPYNETEYIRDGAVEIPTGENCVTASVVVPDWRDYLTSELTDDQEISLEIDWIDKSGNLVLIDTAGVDYRKQFWAQWQGVFDESILD